MSGDEAAPRDVAAGLDELRQLNRQHGKLETERGRVARERGMLAVDLYLVYGVSADTLVDLIGEMTRQGVLRLMRHYGAKSYVMVRRKGAGFEVGTLPLPIGSEGQIALKESRRLAERHREEGWRLVPSRWGVRASEADPAELWSRLES